VSVGALAFGLLAAAANVLGAAAVTWRRRWSDRTLEAMVAFSAGFMIAVVLGDVLPEAFARGGRHAALTATLGFLLVHLTQHTFARHFHFGEETHDVSPMVSASALVGLLLHTFIDGVAIASGFAVDRTVGVLVATAILLHKFPEGLAISSLFLAAGPPRARALGGAALLRAATYRSGSSCHGPRTRRHVGAGALGGVTLYSRASIRARDSSRSLVALPLRSSWAAVRRFRGPRVLGDPTLSARRRPLRPGRSDAPDALRTRRPAVGVRPYAGGAHAPATLEGFRRHRQFARTGPPATPRHQR
jgi:ZIP family zinc transporter/zinc and cadmium transporter